ncbi:astacin-like metalloprotease toxin 4 [Hyalella azteca]|uniref:Metalloendopeptidase n=1 Tax=Hyalella azteca TaxID=294128 RepID=A0A8B7NQ93_HYAAZ|nr:astacin-like metalloprotease toxin 4 [Hyalella azteca]
MGAQGCIAEDWAFDDPGPERKGGAQALYVARGASVGRQGGAQALYVARGAGNAGSVAHELLHALGFGHEHNRPDRDVYVTVHFSNIRPQYWPYPDDGFENDTLPYDYTSILHATSQVRPDVVIDVTKPAITRNDGLTGS